MPAGDKSAETVSLNGSNSSPRFTRDRRAVDADLFEFRIPIIVAAMAPALGAGVLVQHKPRVFARKHLK